MDHRTRYPASRRGLPAPVDAAEAAERGGAGADGWSGATCAASMCSPPSSSRLRVALPDRHLVRHRALRTAAWLGYLGTVVFSGFLQGGVYAMFAVGLTMIFGVMRIINAAHGEMVMMGAYLTWVAFFFLGMDPLLSLALDGADHLPLRDAAAEGPAERGGRPARADRPARHFRARLDDDLRRRADLHDRLPYHPLRAARPCRSPKPSPSARTSSSAS